MPLWAIVLGAVIPSVPYILLAAIHYLARLRRRHLRSDGGASWR